MWIHEDKERSKKINREWQMQTKIEKKWKKKQEKRERGTFLLKYYLSRDRETNLGLFKGLSRKIYDCP